MSRNYKTRSTQKCHYIPEAISTTVDKYVVHGAKFNKTMQCKFNLCDVSNLTSFSYWFRMCFSVPELILIPLILVLGSLSIVFLLTQCKSKQKLNHKIDRECVVQIKNENEIVPKTFERKSHSVDDVSYASVKERVTIFQNKKRNKLKRSSWI